MRKYPESSGYARALGHSCEWADWYLAAATAGSGWVLMGNSVHPRSRERTAVLSVAAAVVLLAGAIYFYANEYDKVAERQCNSVTAIAKDTQKIRYVKEWVATRTANRDFVEAVVKNRWFLRAGSLAAQYIDIDWRYLGFYPDRAWVGFNVDDAEARGADPARIASISLNQGRTGIILKLNPTDDVVGDGPPGNPSTVRSVGDDVFVYCDFGD